MILGRITYTFLIVKLLGMWYATMLETDFPLRRRDRCESSVLS